jgi:hypothetical protein
MNECISPRTGIKSSLPEYAAVIVTSYILWRVFDKPSELTYGEEYDDSGVIKYRFTQNEIDKVQGYFDNNCTLNPTSLQANTLVTTQLEALQTGGLNCFNIFNFVLFSGDADSSERSSGIRRQKTIEYTLLIDLFDVFVMEREHEFKQFACRVLMNEDLIIDNYSKSFGGFWSFFVNQTKFKDQNEEEHDLLVDILDSNIDFHKNGTSRILKKFLKDDFHNAISSECTAKNPSEINNYKSRLMRWNRIFRPVYCNEDNTGSDVSRSQDVQIGSEAVILKRNFSITLSENSVVPDIPKNILFKGVPGTGKSRAIDNILKQYFKLDESLKTSNGELTSRVLRINIHSGTTNASLMQGIGVQTKDEKILYSEKQGLILTFLFQAIQNPNIPFALVLEEIQENSLNILIGDLIYLIEEAKRTDISKIPNIDQLSGDNIYDLVESICNLDSNKINSVTIPNLIKDDGVKSKKLIFPSNLFVFCTSNYREDKKVIEDNLLRRFEVIEIYPNKEAIHNDSVKLFFEELNASIIEIVDDSHSDRLQIGHAIWIDVNNEQSFQRVFLKLIVDFKEIKDFDFDLTLEILERIKDKGLIPFGIAYDFKNFNSYAEMIAHIQSNCGYNFLY